MSERINRRDEIVAAATRLFMEQGYEGTSVRQIAEAVGCTEAALYYHFKDGKRALLSEVVDENMPDFLGLLDRVETPDSFEDAIRKITAIFSEAGQKHIDRFHWAVAEYGTLRPQERAIFHNKQLQLHEKLSELFQPFTVSDTAAHQVAWLFEFILIGYITLFFKMELQHHVPEMSIPEFVEMVSAFVRPPEV
jgi:AcrR family transcriptional regulator